VTNWNKKRKTGIHLPTTQKQQTEGGNKKKKKMSKGKAKGVEHTD